MKEDTPYFLTDATLEEKKAYYENMEKVYREERVKSRKRNMVKVFLFWGIAVAVGALNFIYQDAILLTKILMVGIVITSCICMIATAYSLAVGGKPIPVELVVWYEYLKEEELKAAEQR